MDTKGDSSMCCIYKMFYVRFIAPIDTRYTRQALNICCSFYKAICFHPCVMVESIMSPLSLNIKYISV